MSPTAPPQLLLQEEPLPSSPETVSPGSMDEAMNYVISSQTAWKRTTGLLDWLVELRMRDGPKPNDEGSILFDLLKKGTVRIRSTKTQGATELLEGTSAVARMSGRGFETFQLPKGTKEHDPSKIVCFVTSTGDEDNLKRWTFTSFNYSAVNEVPFWSLLQSSNQYATEKAHICNTCFKCPATLRCGNCAVTWYCSPECQKEDWKKGRVPHKMPQVYQNVGLEDSAHRLLSRSCVSVFGRSLFTLTTRT